MDVLDEILRAVQETAQAIDRPARPTGNRCRCCTCELLFGSALARTKHKVGPWQDRRCLTAAELADGGWRQVAGFWLPPQGDE